MMQWAARQADASIGVCAALVDVLRGWGVAGERLHVFRNGVDLDRFSPPVGTRMSLATNGGPVMLSVGHLIERKGHHLVIAAMPAVLERHPQARLYVIGAGPEQARLAAQVQALGLSDHVTLTGALPNDQLPAWYGAADALVLASSREGWANVLLESMACGTPVVATRIWGTPEVVAHPDAGLLVDQRSSGALATGLLDLLRQPPARAAVRLYAEGFGWAATTRSQIELFEQLAMPAARR